jgi:hypothetical protein
MALSLSKGNMECLSAEAVRKTLAKANGISLVFLTAGGGGVKKGRNQESGIRNQEDSLKPFLKQCRDHWSSDLMLNTDYQLPITDY